MGLVITRREGESIIIGENIEVTVAEFRGRNEVRILIEAPGQDVHRLEVLAKRDPDAMAKFRGGHNHCPGCGQFLRQQRCECDRAINVPI